MKTPELGSRATEPQPCLSPRLKYTINMLKTRPELAEIATFLSLSPRRQRKGCSPLVLTPPRSTFPFSYPLLRLYLEIIPKLPVATGAQKILSKNSLRVSRSNAAPPRGGLNIGGKIFLSLPSPLPFPRPTALLNVIKEKGCPRSPHGILHHLYSKRIIIRLRHSRENRDRVRREGMVKRRHGGDTERKSRK